MKNQKRLFEIKAAVTKPPGIKLSKADHELLKQHGTSYEAIVNHKSAVFLTTSDSEDFHNLLKRLDPIRRAVTGSDTDFCIIVIEEADTKL